jgi:methylenetetrahydrofolate reductase (NADPH)
MSQASHISFEYFPPQTDQGRKSLLRTSGELSALAPEFFSVTYGAGGSTRDRTLVAVKTLREAGHDVAPHLSFGSSTDEDIRELLASYREMGVKRLVALRGDVPSGIGSVRHLRYARELVSFLRATHGDHFHIEVAAYPEVHPDAATPDEDLTHFCDKVAAGANSAITQYFYNADAYFDFCDRAAARGVGIPIVPGIMPITNHDNLVRFSANCGADIPRWIKRRLESYKDDEASLLAFGRDVVAKLCERLLAGGAPGIHFYTLNQAKPTLAICKALALPRVA